MPETKEETTKKTEDSQREGNICIGIGLGVGALAATVASCPICYVTVPLLVGTGIAQKTGLLDKAKALLPRKSKIDLLSEYKKKAFELAQIIEAPASMLPSEVKPDEGYFVQQENNGLLLYYTERGIETLIANGELSEVLYKLFNRITFELGCRDELSNRIPNQDSRRQIWKKQSELLKKIDPLWHQRCQREIDELLIQHPYNDSGA